MNERQKAQNDEEKARIDAQIKKYQEEAAIASANNAQLLAKAQAALADALKEIEANAMLLTTAERNVVNKATTDYQWWMAQYVAAYGNYQSRVDALYASAYEDKDWEAEYTNQLADAKENLEFWSETLKDFESIENKPAQWKAALEDYQNQITELNYKILEIEEGAAVDYVGSRDAFEDLQEYANNLIFKMLDDLGLTSIEKIIEVASLVDLNAKVDDLPKNAFINGAIKKLIDNITSSTDGVGNSDVRSHFVFKPEEGYMGFENAGILDVEDIFKNIVYFKYVIDGVDKVEDNKTNHLLGLNDIVRVLNRDGVVTDSEAATLAEDFGVLAHRADSLYKAHRDTLMKGVAEFDTVNKAIQQYSVDTAALNTATKDLKAAKDSVKKDTTYIAAAFYDDSLAYDAALKKVFAAVKNFVSGDNNSYASKSGEDSTKFYNAVIELGNSQKELFGDGKEDWILMYKTEFDTNHNPKKDSVALSELEKTGFVQSVSGNSQWATSLYGGSGYGYFYNQFEYSDILRQFAVYEISGNSKLAKEASDDAFMRVIKAIVYNGVKRTLLMKGMGEASANAQAELAANEIDVYPEADDFEGENSWENLVKKLNPFQVSGDANKVEWMLANMEKNPAVEDYKVDTAAVNTATATYNTATTAVDNAEKALTGAYNEFYAIYDSFWGYPEGTHKVSSGNASPFSAPEDSLKINWTDETFKDLLTFMPSGFGIDESPFAFNYNDVASGSATLLPSSELAAVLDALRSSKVDKEATKYEDFLNCPNRSHIICGQVSGGAETEFIQKEAYKFLADYYGSYQENLAAVEAFGKAVTDLEAKYWHNVDGIADLVTDIQKELEKIVGIPLCDGDKLNLGDILIEFLNFETKSTSDIEVEEWEEFVYGLLDKYVYSPEAGLILNPEFFAATGMILRLVGDVANAGFFDLGEVLDGVTDGVTDGLIGYILFGASADASITRLEEFVNAKIGVFGDFAIFPMVKNGKIVGLGEGEFAKKAEDLLGGYVASLVCRTDETAKFKKQIKDLEDFVNEFTKAYNKFLAFAYLDASGNAVADNQTSGDTAVTSYADNYEKVFDYISGRITKYQRDVNDAQKALDQLAAGYDPNMINIEKSMNELAFLKEQLEMAKAELEKAKATYEAVIAKYLN